MAYGKEALRRAVAGETGRRLGITTDYERVFQSQVLSAQEAAALAALPVDLDDYAEIQNPLTGALFFLPDMDSLDSLETELQ